MMPAHVDHFRSLFYGLEGSFNNGIRRANKGHHGTVGGSSRINIQ
jgi:hypothetical protein